MSRSPLPNTGGAPGPLDYPGPLGGEIIDWESSSGKCRSTILLGFAIYFFLRRHVWFECNRNMFSAPGTTRPMLVGLSHFSVFRSNGHQEMLQSPRHSGDGLFPLARRGPALLAVVGKRDLCRFKGPNHPAMGGPASTWIQDIKPQIVVGAVTRISSWEPMPKRLDLISESRKLDCQLVRSAADAFGYAG